MPIYEYRCTKCEHVFERMQRMSDKPPKCPKCGGVVSQLLSAPAIQFKGSGFYATDYAKQSASPAPTNGKSKHTETAGSGSDVKISGSKVEQNA